MQLLFKEGVYEVYDTKEESNPISVYVIYDKGFLKLRYRCQTVEQAKEFIKKINNEKWN